MDLAARKDKFVEQFMKIVSIEKIKHFEELMRVENSNDRKVVAYTFDGNPVTQKQYIQNNQDAVDSFKKGEYKTQAEIRKKYSK